MPIGPSRTYDPCNVVRHALKSMRGYNLHPTKPMWEEDIIFYVLSEDVCRERMIKCREIVSYEQEMGKADPCFEGFYPDEEYWVRLDKCVDNFDELVAEVPEAIRKKIDPEYVYDEYIVEVSNEED